MIDDVALQRLWMALQERTWRTAAIVSATRHASTLEMANTLAELCWTLRGESTTALDVRNTSLKLLEQHRRNLDEYVKKGVCVVLALPPLQDSPIAVSLARACDVALMVVRLGETPVAAAKHAIEAIGAERFVGAVLATSHRQPAVVPLFHSDAARVTVKMPAVPRGGA